MKKIVSLLLAALLCFSATAMVSCSDPLRELVNAMNDAYLNFGTQYQYGYEICTLNEQIEEEEVKAQFDEWKTKLADAKDINQTYIDLNEEELRTYADEWNGYADAIKAYIDPMLQEERDAFMQAYNEFDATYQAGYAECAAYMEIDDTLRVKFDAWNRALESAKTTAEDMAELKRDELISYQQAWEDYIVAITDFVEDYDPPETTAE